MRKHIYGTLRLNHRTTASPVAFICRGFGGFLERGEKIKTKGLNQRRRGEATLRPKQIYAAVKLKVDYFICYAIRKSAG